MIKKILKTLLASTILLIVSFIVSLSVNWLCNTRPVLTTILIILLLVYVGWKFANE